MCANDLYQCISLDMPLPDFAREVEPPVDMSAMSAEDWELWQQGARLLLEHAREAAFYVCADSGCRLFLQESVEQGRVRLCAAPESHVFEKKDFVFLDVAERRQNEPVRVSLNTWPCAFLTPEKVIFLARYSECFLTLAARLRAIAAQRHLSFVAIATHPREDMVADVVYALCDAVIFARKYSLNRCSHVTPDMSEGPLVLHPPKADSGEAGLTFNIFRPLGRNALAGPAEADHYFVHGNGKSVFTQVLARKPFLLWCFPFAGSNRFYPTMFHMLQEIGYTPARFYESHYLAQPDAEQGRVEPAVRVFSVLPPNAFLHMHYADYDMQRILELTGAKLLVLTRDMRDVVTSHVHYFYGGNIQFGGASFERFAVEFMEGPSFAMAVRTLCALRHHKDVHFIRFEDIHLHPQDAYGDFFQRSGLSDDPFWVPQRMEPLLRERIELALPRPGSTYLQRKGTIGDWKNHFTPRACEVFRRHAGDILPCFGYEPF